MQAGALQGKTALVTGAGRRLGRADFLDVAEYATFITRSLETAGHLDILINNASVFEPVNFSELTFGELTRHLEVNAWAPFVLSCNFARLCGQGAMRRAWA